MRQRDTREFSPVTWYHMDCLSEYNSIGAVLNCASWNRCCKKCGTVLEDNAFANEVTFTKGAGGVSTADGQFVSDANASRGLGRISGGRMYGYQVRSCEYLRLTCSIVALERP